MSTTMPIKLGVLLSGSGNLQAIIDAVTLDTVNWLCLLA